jgi:hypothetical protein
MLILSPAYKTVPSLMSYSNEKSQFMCVIYNNGGKTKNVMRG